MERCAAFLESMMISAMTSSAVVQTNAQIHAHTHTHTHKASRQTPTHDRTHRNTHTHTRADKNAPPPHTHIHKHTHNPNIEQVQIYTGQAKERGSENMKHSCSEQRGAGLFTDASGVGKGGVEDRNLHRSVTIHPHRRVRAEKVKIFTPSHSPSRM